MSFRRRSVRALATSLGAMTLALLAATGCGPAIPDKPTWENDIAPLFAAHCNRCHGQTGAFYAVPTYPKTDDQASSESFAIMINKAVHGTYASVKRMPPPPAQVLADWQIELIENWTRSLQQ